MKISTSEFIQNDSSSTIIKQLNQYYETHESKLDDDLKLAAYNLLDKENWSEIDS